MKLLNLRKQPKGRKELYLRALLLALPMMIQNGITNAVGLVDNMMVGKLGTESMTGVSICGQLIFVFNLAIFGAISGPGIFGAQFVGNKDVEGVRKTFRIKVWAVIFCVALGLTLPKALVCRTAISCSYSGGIPRCSWCLPVCSLPRS